jgi:endonuclease/exonuclease/phosphatase family metal-dependent hydrolase
MLRRLRLTLLVLAGLTAGVTAAQAQTVPVIGDEGTLDVATWNIEWFGSTTNGPSDIELQFRNVLAVMRQAEIDLWSLQEISSPFMFQRLLDSLGTGWSGELASLGGTQRTAMVWRTGVVERLSMDHILTNFSHAFASRPPQMMRASVTLPDTSLEIRFIALHAKCCGSNDDYNRRLEASNALKNYIDQLLFIDAHVMVLGDFNDRLRFSITSGRTSPYTNFYNDTANYYFSTTQLDLNGTPTYCSNASCTSGTPLDHILTTRNLRDDFIPGSTDRFGQLLTAIPNYVNTTSDHLPVYARFDFKRSVANEPGAETAPQTFALSAPFPNPFESATTLAYDLPHQAKVRLEVFDALGRSVAVVEDGLRPAGRHEARFEAGTLPAGLYLARLTAGDRSVTRRLVVAR